MNRISLANTILMYIHGENTLHIEANASETIYWSVLYFDTTYGVRVAAHSISVTSDLGGNKHFPVSSECL